MNGLNNHSEGLDVNLLITGGKDGFVAYSVTGVSRVPAINPTDLIFVDARATPKRGDIVVLSENGLKSVEIFEPQNFSPLRLATAPQKSSRDIIGVVTSALRVFAEVRP